MKRNSLSCGVFSGGTALRLCEGRGLRLKHTPIEDSGRATPNNGRHDRELRHRRTGYTLVEMVVAISLIAVLMTISGTLFVALTRSERNAQRSAAAQQVIARLDDVFRRDVHRALAAAVEPQDEQPTVLNLTQPDGSTIRYSAEETKLTRISQVDGKAHRDDFRIVAGQWRFDMQGQRVELRLQRPADTLTQPQTSLTPVRECRLLAVLSLTPSKLPQPGGQP